MFYRISFEGLFMNLMQEDLEKNVVSTAIQGAQDIGEFVSLPNESFTTDIYRDIQSM